MFAAELWMDTPAAQTEKQPEAGVSVRQTALVGTLVHYMTEVETYGELTIESRECLGMVVRANADGSLDLRGDPVTWNFCTNKVPSLHGEARRGQYSASHEPGTWHHGGYKIVLEDHEEVQR
ncbi:MAG: hypothetical protein IMZ62_16545 [Chloroflexi bacterium]|nr:hypothetical protein [Chloroflexota bacterium]